MRRDRLLALLALLFAACTERSGGASIPWPDAGPSGPSDAAPAIDAQVVDTPRADGGDTLDDVIVWAHSSSELYAFDPRTREVRTVGAFTVGGEALREVTDLAVDAGARLWACSFDRLYRVDPVTAAATEIGPLDLPSGERFNALTFVPSGTLDGTSETLVAATAEGALYRVDTTTGAASALGRFGDGWGSSGDIVSVAGAGTFVTVTRDDQPSDVIARLDVATGAVTPIGGIGHTRVFGLAYWRSRLYGFSTFGHLVEIDIDTGRGRTVARSSAIYWGAGVTTIAPTIPF